MSPAWPCSWWGLPSRPVARVAGALLPHRFTLACAVAGHRRSVLCGTFLRVAPTRLASTLPCGAPTFLDAEAPRPPGRLTVHDQSAMSGATFTRVTIQPTGSTASVGSVDDDAARASRATTPRVPSPSSTASSGGYLDERWGRAQPGLGRGRGPEARRSPLGPLLPRPRRSRVRRTRRPDAQGKVLAHHVGRRSKALASARPASPSRRARSSACAATSTSTRRVASSSFIVTALDLEALRLSALGEHARRREVLVRRLADEGLLEANRALVLRARAAARRARGLEGDRGVQRLPRGARAVGVRVPGDPRASGGAGTVGRRHRSRAAMRALGRAGCDVVCVVRGGGSQADLAAFDDERLARAIAACPVPVLTGDRAHRRRLGGGPRRARGLPDPDRVRRRPRRDRARVVPRARRASPRSGSTDVADAVLDELDRRHRPVAPAPRRRRRGTASSARPTTLRRRPAPPPAWRRTPSSRAGTALRYARGASTRSPATASPPRATGSRRAGPLLAAYDPTRLLARGWSITTDATGAVVRSVAGLEAGAALATRLADGVARSTVTGVERPGEGEDA